MLGAIVSEQLHRKFLPSKHHHHRLCHLACHPFVFRQLTPVRCLQEFSERPSHGEHEAWEEVAQHYP